MFPFEFCEIFKGDYLEEQLLPAAFLVFFKEAPQGHYFSWFLNTIMIFCAISKSLNTAWALSVAYGNKTITANKSVSEKSCNWLALFGLSAGLFLISVDLHFLHGMIILLIFKYLHQSKN